MIEPILDNFRNIDPDLNFFSETTEDSCKYYTLNEFPAPLWRDYFCLLNYNIRSFFANSESIESILDCTQVAYNSIILTETWNKQSSLDLCKIDGYSGFHSCRSGNSRSGGVSVFCLDRYASSICENLTRNDNIIESCGVTFWVNNVRTIVIGIYRPVSGNILDFVAALESLISTIDLDRTTVILAGDFKFENH